MVATRSSLRLSQGISPEAFHAAARDGDVELVQSFLQRQAAVDLRDDGGATPLIIAAANGHEACVRVLLDGGADLNAAKVNGYTALMDAAQEGHLSVLQLLLQRGAGVHKQSNDVGINALMAACNRGHTTCMAALLDAGADINGSMAYGCTALFVAAQKGHLDALQLLLQRGADVHKQSNDDEISALRVACTMGHAMCVAALLDAGADYNTSDKKGGRALHVASMHGHLDVMEILLKRGADPDTRLGSVGNVAQVCMYLWQQEEEEETKSFANVTESRRKKAPILLARWSHWNFQWRSKKLPIMLRARHNKREDICAGGSQGESYEMRRDLMVWLVSLGAKGHEGIFRAIVSYL
ncbi:unnamed protein product [Chrysoparadoxa australica]